MFTETMNLLQSIAKQIKVLDFKNYFNYNDILLRYGFNLLFLWLPAGFLIDLFYKSTLLASLVRVSYEKPMDTWQSLLENDMTLAIPIHLIQNELMYSSPKPVVQ